MWVKVDRIYLETFHGFLLIILFYVLYYNVKAISLLCFYIHKDYPSPTPDFTLSYAFLL